MSIITVRNQGMQTPGLVKSFYVEGSIKRFRFVKLGTDANSVKAVAAVTDKVIGVADLAIVTQTGKTQTVPVIINGTAICRAGGAIVKGATVEITADGSVDDTSGTGQKVGKALDAASAAGDLVQVLIDIAE